MSLKRSTRTNDTEIFSIIKYQFIVEQGCGDLPKEFNDTPFAKCNRPLCNSKDLFDKTLFCFNNVKEDIEPKKGIKQCNQKCYVHRHFDGKCLFLVILESTKYYPFTHSIYF